MKRRLIMAILLLIPVAAMAEGSLPFQYNYNLSNKASLQRGAKVFMNYCSGCHTLTHMRYNTIAEDLGIPPEVMENNLMMTTKKIRGQVEGTMPDKAENWFGTAPPDLTLVARQRGADWLYSFLLSFYLDPSRPSGVNNLVMENTAMPWALWPLQGYQKKVSAEQGGGEAAHGAQFKLAQKGSMTPEEFRSAVGDLVNFLVYVGEPMKLVRYSLGLKVLLFLFLFTVLAYFLKREYWHDVH